MARRPNIVFFLTDQQRWDTCGCYGQRLPTTPNLDAMARDGLLFENAYTCQPVCGPARACLQTGRYATELGCHRNDLGLPRDARTIARIFSEGGYRTGYIGKWHLASSWTESSGEAPPPGAERVDFRTAPVPPEYRGGWKDEWIASDVLEFTSHSYDGHMFDREGRVKPFPAGRYRADAQTDWVLETLDRWGRDMDPFFLFVSYIEPHHQNDHGHYEGPRGSKERFSDFAPPPDLADEGGDWPEEFPDYLGCVRTLDDNLGRVRRKLSELGIAEDTLLVFTSDHGSHFRTRNRDLTSGYDDYKRTFHEGASHVPLVAVGPGFKGGVRLASMVSLIDLPPTFLDAAGLDIPGEFRGSSILPLATGEEPDARDEVFMQISESMVARALRTRRWSYAVVAEGKDGWSDPGSEEYVEAFIYDLASDPAEKRNLVRDPGTRAIRDALRDRIRTRMAGAGEVVPRIAPAE